MSPRSLRRSSERALIASGALFAVLLFVAPCRAGADEAKEKAKQHNAAAEKYFNLGKFKEAAGEYEKAYQAKAMPVFLHNLGQCYKRMAALENLERARFYFESYLNNSPDAPNKEEVKEEIAALKKQIEQLRKAKVSSQPTRTSTPTREQKPLSSQLPPAPPPPPEDRDVSQPFYRKWWFWTAVGVVVAGATTATVIALQPEDMPNQTGTMGEIQF